MPSSELPADHAPATDTGVAATDGEAGTGSRSLPPGVDGPPGLLLRLFRDQRIVFLFVGGLNTVIGTIWFALFDHLLGYRWNGFGHYPALVITYVFAILCAFVLYRRLVFMVRGHVWRDLRRFSTVYISAFLVNITLLAVFVHGFGWQPLLSQCLIVFVTTAFSWVGHHRYSFKRTPDEASQSESGERVEPLETAPEPSSEKS